LNGILAPTSQIESGHLTNTTTLQRNDVDGIADAAAACSM
jgi:hypothetical protein